MTTQYDFSNDDWQAVAATPLLVGLAVARAEDSGFFGSIREARSLLATIGDGSDDNPARSLIAQAAATDTTTEYDAYKVLGPEALATDAESACRRLAELLARVAEPAEAEGYKRWVVEVADAVARSAKEGGTLVSHGEVEVMARVARALGLQADRS